MRIAVDSSYADSIHADASSTTGVSSRMTGSSRSTVIRWMACEFVLGLEPPPLHIRALIQILNNFIVFKQKIREFLSPTQTKWQFKWSSLNKLKNHASVVVEKIFDIFKFFFNGLLWENQKKHRNPNVFNSFLYNIWTITVNLECVLTYSYWSNFANFWTI